jgi:hypothetical protein
MNVELSSLLNAIWRTSQQISMLNSDGKIFSYQLHLTRVYMTISIVNEMKFKNFIVSRRSRDNSASIMIRYGLSGREYRVRLPEGIQSSLFDQTGPGTHPASYPIDTEGIFFPGSKAADEVG